MVEPPEARVQYIVDPLFPKQSFYKVHALLDFEITMHPDAGVEDASPIAHHQPPPPHIQNQPKSRCLGRKY